MVPTPAAEVLAYRRLSQEELRELSKWGVKVPRAPRKAVANVAGPRPVRMDTEWRALVGPDGRYLPRDSEECQARLEGVLGVGATWHPKHCILIQGDQRARGTVMEAVARQRYRSPLQVMGASTVEVGMKVHFQIW